MARDRKAGWLEMFVIYDHPKDIPDSFVIRRWQIGPEGQIKPDAQPFGKAYTLEAIRTYIPKGMTIMVRNPADDPVIVETWM